MSVETYYFGCWGGVGHSLWLPNRERADGWNAAGPWDRIDGHLTPKSTEQSAAAIHHLHGWTALAMHDYTVDSRRGSNSVFIFAEPDLTFEQALSRAAEAFPAVLARIVAASPVSLDDSVVAS